MSTQANAYLRAADDATPKTCFGMKSVNVLIIAKESGIVLSITSVLAPQMPKAKQQAFPFKRKH